MIYIYISHLDIVKDLKEDKFEKGDKIYLDPIPVFRLNKRMKSTLVSKLKSLGVKIFFTMPKKMKKFIKEVDKFFLPRKKIN